MRFFIEIDETKRTTTTFIADAADAADALVIAAKVNDAWPMTDEPGIILERKPIATLESCDVRVRQMADDE